LKLSFRKLTLVLYANAGGQPYGEAYYVNIEFLLVLATGITP
jgi:hypothetical protein